MEFSEAVDQKFLHRNYNLLASSLLIQIWQKLGLSTYYVSPGYRDAPFIAALQATADLSLHSCPDERAGGYQALGFAKFAKQPAALVCTSGTAGANYYPAVIEAFTDRVPLLIVTADRPFELVHAGAQQVIDQRDLFGRFVKKSFDFPAPGPSWEPAAWLSYAQEIFRLALAYPAGPVHINLPFKSPLDPVAGKDVIQPSEIDQLNSLLDRFVPRDLIAHRFMMPHSVCEELTWEILAAKRGLLILGRLSEADERHWAKVIKEKLDWPYYADVGSGCQGSGGNELLDLIHPSLIDGLRSYNPDCVIHLGRRLVTRSFDDLLSTLALDRYWVVTDEQGIQDPSHLPVRRQVNGSLAEIARKLPQQAPVTAGPEVRDLMTGVTGFKNKLATMGQEEFNFVQVARSLIMEKPKEKHGLFLGNSTAVRAFDSWLPGDKLDHDIYLNRGVNGIEGLLATVLGLYDASQMPWTLVLGDISLIHDLNSVLLLGQKRYPIILVLVNNLGGRIFDILPIQEFRWVKDPLITTPHHFSFEGIADMAQIPYSSCVCQRSFELAYRYALTIRGPYIIECLQEANADQKFISALRRQGE